MNSALVRESIANMHSGPESIASEDHSFIVLDRVTAEDSERIESELVASMQSVHLGSAAFSQYFSEVPPGPTVGSTSNIGESNDISSFGLPSEVQQRMDSLIQDNIQLKETVDQTNLVLKQMMLTLAQWGTDMQKVRQDHKERFQETRSRVMQLQKEKAEMRAEMELLRNQASTSNGRTEKEMELIASVSELSDKLSASEAACLSEIEKNRCLLEEISLLKEQMTFVEVKQEQPDSRFENLEAELNTLKTAHKAVIEENQAYSRDIALLRERLAQTESQVEEFVSLQSTVDKLKTDVVELEKLRLENERLKIDIQTLSSVERHTQDYQVAQAKGFSLRVDELTAKLLLAEEELGKARCEIRRLRGVEGDEGNGSNPPSGDDTALRNAEATVNRLRLRIDEMTARIVHLEQKCESQTQEIQNFHEENLMLHRQNESIAILRAQVDVYQSDFLAERESRERLAGEKEQLAEDLRRLHQRNRELQDQQIAREDAVAPRNDDGNRNSEQLEDELQANASYRCPVCQTVTFSSLHTLNEHIDRCTEIQH